MTDRIQQLMEETGLYIAYENREITEKELRYFAEAIVQECGWIADRYADENLRMLPSHEMKKKFGVKE